MSIFSKIFGAFKWLGRLLGSKEVKAALGMVDDLVPQILPIVTEINRIVPSAKSASFSDILSVYNAFGKSASQVKDDPKSFGASLAALALSVAKSKIHIPGIPDRIINFAIEAAVMALKAK